MERQLYNLLVPRFLRHFGQKYLCRHGFHKTPKNWQKQYNSTTCQRCFKVLTD